MKPQALMRWTRSVWQVAGPAAPVLISRYGRLTALNRTSRQRVITAVPARRTLAVQPAPHGDVVVPVYNNFDDTSTLLAALETDRTIPGKIILVHDCSTDRRVGPLLQAYAQRDSRVELIENEKNAGFVHTCNRGIMASKRDVVILNTDIDLPAGTVARMLARLRADDATATVTPLSNAAYGVGLPDLLYGNPMPFGASASDVTRALHALPALEEIALPTGIGFCMGMSRAVIDAIGPFDEAFGLGYGEETDFCMRAVKRGYGHVLAADCFVGHKGGQSFGASWQDLSRKGTLKVLHRHPFYLDRIASYLARGETRSLSFAALITLMQELSSADVAIDRDGRVSSGEGAPAIGLTKEGGVTKATLNWRGESYAFRFVNEDVFDSALALTAEAQPAKA